MTEAQQIELIEIARRIIAMEHGEDFIAVSPYSDGNGCLWVLVEVNQVRQRFLVATPQAFYAVNLAARCARMYNTRYRSVDELAIEE